MANNTSNSDRLKRTRGLVNLVTPGHGGGIVGMMGGGMLGGAILATLTSVILATFLILMFSAKTTKGTTPVASTTPLDCAAVAGTCRASCLTGENPDTSGVTCINNPSQICCVTQTQVAPGSKPPLKFFCQYGAVNSAGKLISPRSWNTSSCNIEVWGCGPTSLAMIIDSFGKSFTPTQVALVNGNNGCGGTAGGTGIQDVTAYFAPWLKNQGFLITGNMVSNGNLSLTQAKQYLNNGYYIWAGAKVRWITNAGWTSTYDWHAIVITTVNTNGSVVISDPTLCEAGHYGGIRTLTNVNSSGSDISSVNGWIFAYAVKPK